MGNWLLVDSGDVRCVEHVPAVVVGRMEATQADCSVCGRPNRVRLKLHEAVAAGCMEAMGPGGLSRYEVACVLLEEAHRLQCVDAQAARVASVEFRCGMVDGKRVDKVEFQRPMGAEVQRG